MANQVTTRFVADITAYVANVQKAQDILQKYGLNADKTMIKQIQGHTKVVQAQAQQTISTAKVAAATANMEKAQIRAAEAQQRVAITTANVAKAQAQASLAQQRLKNAIDGTSSAQDNMLNKMTTNMRSVIGQYLSLAAIVGILKKIIGEGIGFNMFVETTTTAFGVMMKSIDAAKTKMQELYDWAVKSPLTFKETVSASKQLLAYGFSAKSLVSTMETLGTVSKATGHSLDDIAYVYGTLKTQGRAYTRDLMQFAMRGIPIYDELAKVLDVPKEKIQKLTEAGKVMYAQVEQAFKNMTTSAGVYAGYLEEYMKTLEGKLAMLSDVWLKSEGVITKGMNDALIPLVERLTATLVENEETFKQWGTAFAQVLNILSGLLEALIPIIQTLGYVLGKINWDVILIGLTAVGIATGNIALASIALTLEASKLATQYKNENIKNAKEITDAWVKANREIYGNDYKRESMRMAGAAAGPSPAALADMSDASEEIDKYMAKLRDEYAKYLAERERDEKGVVDAVINYERMKKIAEARELLTGETLTQALAYINTMYNYESEMAVKAAKEKAQKEKDAMEDLLETYRDKYMKFSQDEIGLLDYEYQKEMEIIDEKFKGEAKLHDQAKKWIDEEYAYRKEQARQKQMDDLIEAVKNFNATTPQGYSAMIPSISSYEEGAILQEKIQAQIDAIQSQINAGGLLDGQYKELTDNINAFNEVIKGIVDKTRPFVTIWDMLEKNLKEQIASLDLVLGRNRETKGASFKKIPGLLNPNAGEAAPIVNDIGRAIAWPVLKLVQGVAEGWKALGPLLKVSMTNFLLSLKETALGQEITKLQGSYATRKTEGVSTGLNVAMTAGEGIVDLLAGPTKAIIDFVLNIVKQSKPLTDVLQAITVSVSSALMPILDSLGEALAWLYDSIIVPVGNAIILLVNAIIQGINKTFGKWLGFKIKEMHMLEKTTDVLKDMAKAAVATDALAETVSYLQDKLDSLIENQIDSLTDLYEVGAITATEYAAKMDTIEKQYSTEKSLLSTADKQLSTLDAIYERLTSLLVIQGALDNNTLSAEQIAGLLGSTGLATSAVTTISKALYESLKSYGVDMSAYKKGSYASGTSYVPQNMSANIHKGEMIIPSDFSSAIRRGDLSLSRGGSSGENVNVVVNVAGNIQTEKDLAKSIAEAIYNGKRSGNITVSLA